MHGNSVKGLTLCIGNWDERQPTSFDCDVLRDFINCLSDLDYLTLDIWSFSHPFELSWIESHASTLERLYICISSATNSIDYSYGYDILPLEHLRRLCGSFQRLKQDAICLPKIDLLFEKSDNKKLATYKSYLVSCSLRLQYDSRARYSDLRQTALASLRNLKTLRIFTWPIAPLSCINKAGDRDKIQPAVFDSLLEKFANMAVTNLTAPPSPNARPDVGPEIRSKLKIVCFGDRHIWTLEASDGEHYRANPRCYVVDHREEGSVVKAVTAKTAQDHVVDASAWHVPYGERMEEE